MTRAQKRSTLHASLPLAIWLAILFGWIGGCSPTSQGNGPGHRTQALALSPQQELQLGRDLYAQVLAEANIRTKGPEFERVQRVSGRIAEAVQIDPLQREINLHFTDYRFEWEYCVVESEQINAFCLPGGKICVCTGLLSLVRNDDQLGAVIAHEVAHAVAHHTSERFARAQTSGHGFLSLAFDREQESEADHIGVFLMTFAGYDPEQAVAFWGEMEKARGSQIQIPEILSDHPSDQRRMNQLKQWVPLAKAAQAAYVQGRVASSRR